MRASLALRCLSGPAVAVLCAIAAAAPVSAQDFDLDALHARVDAVLAEWRIPGLALAVVRGDSTFLARGYGVRRAGGPEPVDERTLFAIGSTTKAFTAAAVAMLVAEGRLGWDDRVADRLPGFALMDPWVTRRLTVRDALAHRSGLPMANLMWLIGEHGPDELVRRLRHLEPAAGFRSALTYQNVLYLAAGQVVSEAAGVPWSEFVDARILRPLGMTGTRTGTAGLDLAGNVAMPHAPVDGAVRPVPYRDIGAVGPAGALLSNARDMARWLRFQLAAGRIDGRRLIPEDALLETRRPQIVMRRDGPLAAFYPDARALSYGMGWVVSDYRGRTLLDHGGGIDGMTALVALVPEARLGVAILANLQLPAPPYWLLYPLLDALLGHEPVDRTAAFRAIAEQVDAVVNADPPRTPGSRPSLPLAAYAGRYVSDPIGEALVALDAERLTLRLGRLQAPLEPWHFDTFRADWTDRAWRAAAGPGWVGFRLDRHGAIEDLVLEAVPGEQWVFRRRLTAPPARRPRRGSRSGRPRP